jgi:hypothetical protein
MLRKLIMFAITSGLAKKAFESYRRKNRAPSPTSRDPLRDSAGRTRRTQG